MIREATVGDLDTILEITKSCAKELVSKNIFQWNDYYPNRSAFENDLYNKWLYVTIKESMFKIPKP